MWSIEFHLKLEFDKIEFQKNVTKLNNFGQMLFSKFFRQRGADEE